MFSLKQGLGNSDVAGAFLLRILIYNMLMRRIFVYGFLSATIFFLTQTSFAYAANATTTNTSAFVSGCSLVNNLVRVDLLHGATQVSTNSGITISGTIENDNQYPLPDLSLVVRVIKLAKKSGSAYDTATDTVARILPLTGIYIGANSTVSFSFTWHIPSNLVAGPYSVDIFLNGSDQFAIGGNEYLNIPAATYPLAISGSQTQTSFFDLSTFRANGIAPMAQLLSTFSSTSVATTSIAIANTYDTPHDVTVDWYLYYGNFVNDSSLVASTTSKVHISPGTKNTVSFAYTNFMHAKYLLVGELQDGDKRSFFSTRISRTDVIEPSARSLYLSSFPLISSKHSVVIGCITQNFSNDISSTTIGISLTELNGLNIYSTNFSVAKNNPLVQFSIPFIPATSTTQSMVLTLSAFDGSTTIKSVVSYLCNSITCPAQTSILITSLYFVSIIVVVVIFIGLIFLERKRLIKKRSELQNHVQ